MNPRGTHGNKPKGKEVESKCTSGCSLFDVTLFLGGPAYCQRKQILSKHENRVLIFCDIVLMGTLLTKYPRLSNY